MNKKHNSNLVPYAQKLRRTMTKEERHLWYDFLCNYPTKFVKQKVVDDYILDFYCSQAKLALELDGSQHYEKEYLLKDTIRTQQLNQYGITVYRIPNNIVFTRFRELCEHIDHLVKEAVG